MARNFAGGTDRIAYTGNIGNQPAFVTIAARFKTSSGTSNAQMLGHWTSASRRGWGLLLNSAVAGKVRLVGYDSINIQLDMTSSTTITDGAWHSLVCNMNLFSGTQSTLYIDGNLDASANSSANWSFLTTDWLTLGDSVDPFWGSYTGDLADIGYWTGNFLTADESIAYCRGFSPAAIRPANLQVYAPLVRDMKCLRGSTIPSSSGTTVSDHPRVMASLV